MMQLRPLLWLVLFQLLAASTAIELGLQRESLAPLSNDSATRAPDGDDAVRPAALVEVRIVARTSNPQGAGGAGAIPPGLPPQRLRSGEAEHTPTQLAVWETSHATAAHGGPLLYFPTAPPLHG